MKRTRLNKKEFSELDDLILAAQDRALKYATMFQGTPSIPNIIATAESKAQADVFQAVGEALQGNLVLLRTYVRQGII